MQLELPIGKMNRVYSEANYKIRLAKCSYQHCGGKYGMCPPPVPSHPELPFFKELPTEPYDEYYCGECWGWD